MSCDRDICATNEYNGIGCDECCVSYDTAVQREQDAYDSGFAKAIECVLELIDSEIQTVADGATMAFWHTRNGACETIKRKVLALKGGEEQ